MLKVATVCGTRPEIIRLSETIKKLDLYTDHILIHTGQSYDYEMSQIFFDELKIRKPNYTLDVKADNLGRQIGNILAQVEDVLLVEKPDCVLILGDTNSALSCIIAKRLGIKVIHMEAGNRCFDERVPEEINRRIVDHTSDINLCYTEHARRNLLRDGLHPNNIYVIGSPLSEVYKVHRDAIFHSKILEKLDLVGKKYLLASIHREENVREGDVLMEIINGLGMVSRDLNAPIIFSTHPRTAKQLEGTGLAKNNGLQLHKPFGMLDYVKLEQRSLCFLSDSGTLHEDAAIFGLSAVINIRNSNERPEVYETGNVIMSGIDRESILQSARVAMKQESVDFETPHDYRATNYSDKAVRLIMSVCGRD
jgi:UDP-N-acetylglucosamine 2-epimerase (non-hydrolysing)